MPDLKKVIRGLECCLKESDHLYSNPCNGCPYERQELIINDCIDRMKADALALLKEQEVERQRMISWLGKFCRHIDNGDKWLSDEENIAFFREKMKQQFGWDS